jgi:hypothetical protein
MPASDRMPEQWWLNLLWLNLLLRRAAEPTQLGAGGDVREAHELRCFLFSRAAQHDLQTSLDRQRDAA